MKVQVFEHDGCLIMNPSQTEPIDERGGSGWWPTGGQKIGCVVGNTKGQLEISQEALDLLKTLENSLDDIGDVDWWWCEGGTHAFAWLGPIFRIVKIADAEGARDTTIHPKHCTIIPNAPTPEMIEAVENGGDYWREPIRHDY